MKGVAGVLLCLAACHGVRSTDAAAVVRRWTTDSVYYEASGRGPALVLLHAFSTDHRAWDAEAAHWRSRYRVVTIDARGHGRSPLPTSPFHAYDDVVHVLDTLGIRQATLMGLSSGSRIALDVALAHPERVTALVLASAAPGGFVAREPATYMAPVIAAARAGKLPEAAAAWADTPIMYVADSTQRARLRAIVMDNASLWGVRSNPEQPLTPPAIERLSAVRVPTLVLSGALDGPSLREAALNLARAVSGARLVEFPGVVHMLNFAAPDAFRAAVDQFLAR